MHSNNYTPSYGNLLAGARSNAPLVSLLFVFVAFYVANVLTYYWTLPAPSDPLQYLGSAVFGTTYGYWPWADRLMLANNLRLFSFLVEPTQTMGMYYILFVNSISLTVGLYLAFKWAGPIGAAFFGAFFNASYLTLGWSTYVYPDQTAACFSMLALLCWYFAGPLTLPSAKWLFACGVFCAFALFSKATGVAAGMFFFLLCLFEKNWSNLLIFVLGGVLGVMLVPLLFIVLYNYESLTNVIFLFFKHGFDGNPVWTNYVNYTDLILDSKFAPVFLVLFVSVSAYRNQNSRIPLLYAWSFVFILFCVYSFSDRGGGTIPHYLYPAFIAAMLALSIHLGSAVSLPSRAAIQIGYILLVLLVLGLGLNLGYRFPTLQEYNFSYNYDLPLDVYDPDKVFNYSPWIRVAHTAGPILLFVCLLGVELSKMRWLNALLIPPMIFYTAFLGGGLAIKKTQFDREEAGFFYREAPAIVKAESKNLGIYVESWHSQAHADRILWVYRLFFDEQFERGNHPHAQYDHELEINRGFEYLANKDALKQTKKKFLLTDNPDALREFYAFRLVSDYVWHETRFYVVEITQRLGEIDKYELAKITPLKPEFVFAPTPISSDELHALRALPAVGGIRGSFSYTQLESEITLRSVAADLNSEHELQLTLADERLTPIANATRVAIAMEVQMEHGAAIANIFLQDSLDGDWDRRKTKIQVSSEWKEHWLAGYVRSGSDEVQMGLYWEPQRVGDSIRVRNIKIYPIGAGI